MITLSILCLLFSNAVTLRRDMSILFNRIAIIALIYCFLHEIMSLSLINKGIGLHGGLLHVTNITQIFHIFVFMVCILILQLTSFFPRKVWVKQHSSLQDLFQNFLHYRSQIMAATHPKMGEHLKIIEYPLILLFVVSGAIFLMSTNDLVSIFLSIELQSYGLYLLSTIYRNSELATTGGLIYFLLGGLSSCFILLGTSLLYANSGTTNLDGLYIITSISDNTNTWYQPYYINFSLLIFSIGFLFKVSAAPFHFWSPDVYDAIPTIVTTFVAIIAKISIFILLLEIVYYTSNSFSSEAGASSNWTFGLLMSSLLSLIIGTIVGLTQFRLKRLLAYSTISHVGFILLALSITSIESIQAFVFYLMQYSISNLNAFIILVAIGFSFYFYVTQNKQYKELLDKNNSPVQLISQLRGYFYVNPVLALSLAITIFSFAGIPPLVGFFAKQMVLSAALDSGYVFLSLVAILTSVVGAVYYLNIIKEIFFYKPEYKINSLLKDKKFLGGIRSQAYIYDNKNLAPELGSASGSRLTTHSTAALNKEAKQPEILEFKYNNIVMSSPISITIASITLMILLFIFMNKEWLSMGTIIFLFLLWIKKFFTCNLLLLFRRSLIIKKIASYTQQSGSFSSYSFSYIRPSIVSINRTRNIRVSKLSQGLFSNFSLQTLKYSTGLVKRTSSDTKQCISPFFISGYTDAEGCFNISIQKNPNGKFYVRPQFKIEVHSKDKNLLKLIQDHLGGIGNIYSNLDKSKFMVKSLDDILKIITHFSKYPLITQKKADFILFKEIINKVVKGEHLSAKGLQEILNIKASLRPNLGLSNSFKTLFPNTVPVTRPLIENNTVIHPEWMAGFISGEGCFLVEISKNGKTCSKLDTVSLSFKVSQHLRDELLLKSFISFFKCGMFNYHSGRTKLGSGVFIVRKFTDIWDKILPFFKDHEIRGIKREDLNDWAKVAELMKSKDHLCYRQEKGVRKIREIKSCMNTLR